MYITLNFCLNRDPPLIFALKLIMTFNVTYLQGVAPLCAPIAAQQHAGGVGLRAYLDLAG